MRVERSKRANRRYGRSSSWLEVQCQMGIWELSGLQAAMQRAGGATIKHKPLGSGALAPLAIKEPKENSSSPETNYMKTATISLHRQGRKAFTLIEIIGVLAVIAILAA